MADWHDEDTHSPVWEGTRAESTQKRRPCTFQDHFGKNHRRALGNVPPLEPVQSLCGPQQSIASFRLSSNMRVTRARTLKKLFFLLLVAGFAVHSAAWTQEERNQEKENQSKEKKTAGELTVAGAADLSSALTELAGRYEKRAGVTVKLSFGASGALTQQIQNGAPFDVFFSADMDYPRRLIAAADADAASLYEYAVGKLVLWVPADSLLDVQHKGMNVLLDPSVQKISIANPQHAPYGRAAVAALKHTGLYDKVSVRLVFGENISQAAEFVESGNAQAGFVALAHALAPSMRGKGKYWELPADYYPPLAQGVVVLSHSEHKKDATEFIEYIKSEEAASLLRKYGFSLPK
jgi:molybdate transport system substrate-binding protein